MFNIFNLFLVLFTCWIILLATNSNISWVYIVFGMVASMMISIISWKIKIIDKNTEFLFLNFGFYRHYLPIIFFSLFKSLPLLIKFSLIIKEMEPVIYHFDLKQQKQNNNRLALFIATIAIMPGIFCIGIKRKKMIIHALDEEYFEQYKLEEIYNNLYKVNDNRLV